MNGSSARRGFAFQDWVLLDEVLAVITELRVAKADDRLAEVAEVRFAVEGTPSEGAPEWDLLREEASGRSILLTEVKGGGVTPADRKALWLRARRTTAREPRSLRVRLVIDAGNPPAALESLKAVATTAERFIGSKLPDPPEGSILDADAMLAEALHVLCRKDDDSEALKLEQALGILRHFVCDASRSRADYEELVRGKLVRLGLAAGNVSCTDQLRGFVDRHAEAKGLPQRWFTATELIGELTLLARLAHVDPRTAELWRAWSRAAEAVLPLEPMQLRYQAWREVQPVAAERIGNRGSKRIALVAPGGFGKTIMLRALLLEVRGGGRTIFLDASDLCGRGREELEAVLSLGCFVAAAQGTSLAVFVDGIEELDRVERVALLSALAERRDDSPRACVASRAIQWEAIPPDLRGAWGEVYLEPWARERVEQLAALGARPIDDKLQSLLGNPLLLDIFLRTFGRSSLPPAGLQTRHGIIAAYFSQRVLRSHGDVSEGAVYTHLTMQMAPVEASAEGPCSHVADVPAAYAMLSEGLLAAFAGGRVRFRHDVLRDFAMQLWARSPFEEGLGVEAVLRSIATIRRPLARYGALRALVESVCALPAGDRPVLAELVSHARDRDQAHEIFEILGRLDDPSSLDLESLDAQLPEEARQWCVGSSLFRSVRIGQNAGWLPTLARLPIRPAWADGSRLLDDGALVELGKLLEIFPRSPTLAAIGARIESWADVPRLRHRLEEHQDHGWFVILRAVGHRASSRTTLSWMLSVADRSWRTRFAVLDVLPELAERPLADGNAADPAELVDLFVSAGGLQQRNGLWMPSSDGMHNYDALHRALVGEGLKGPPSLLDSQPRFFLPVAFSLLGGQGEERGREMLDSALEGAWQDQVAAWKAEREPPSALEGRLEEECQTKSTPAEALGELIDDLGGARYAEGFDEWRRLLVVWLQQHVRRARDGDDSAALEVYWSAARNSRSVLARVLLIDIMTETDEPKATELIDEVLQDHRLYHIHGATYFLWHTIRARWPGAAKAVRDGILEAIRSVRFSPLVNGVFAVGPFLDAVPEQDRPADLLPFLEIHRELGQDPAPSAPKPIRLRPSIPSSEKFVDEAWEHGRFGTADAPASTRWRELWDLDPDPPDQASDAVAAALDLLTGLMADLPTYAVLSGRRWPLGRLRRVLELALRIRRRDSSVGGTVDTAVLERLGEWALELASQDIDEQAQRHAADSTQPTLWADALEFLNVLLSFEELDQDTWRSRFFGEVARPPLTPSMARHLVASIDSCQWFAPGEGRELLLTLLTACATDASALRWSIRHLPHFSAEEQQQILTRWLEEPYVTGDNDARAALAGDVGQYLGSRALRRGNSGELSWPRDVVDTLIAVRPLAGLLGKDRPYQEWLFGVVRGALAGDESDARWRESTEAYAQLADRVWSRLSTLDCYRHPRSRSNWPNFALFAFSNILGAEHVEVGDRRRNWDLLRALLQRVVVEGPASELWHIVFALREGRAVDIFGAERLMSVFWGLSQRMARDPGEVARAEHPKDNWLDVIRYTCESILNIAQVAPGCRDDLLRILGSMGDSGIVEETRQKIRRL